MFLKPYGSFEIPRKCVELLVLGFLEPYFIVYFHVELYRFSPKQFLIQFKLIIVCIVFLFLFHVVFYGCWANSFKSYVECVVLFAILSTPSNLSM